MPAPVLRSPVAEPLHAGPDVRQVVFAVADGDGCALAHHDALLCRGEPGRAAVEAVRHVSIGLHATAADRIGEVGDIGHPEMQGFHRYAEQPSQLGVGGAELAEVEGERAVVRLVCTRMAMNALAGALRDG